jgi:pseudouridine-5'-phosphate glycosidase
MSIAPRVADVLAGGGPVVALESTVIAHGLPYPRNVETAHALETAVRDAGAEPATIGVIDGRLVVGLGAGEIDRLAHAGKAARKLSRRDLGAAIAQRALGATTVAATMIAAARAGIRIFATGGIGGVHRGGERSLDVSADLQELARTPVAVVAAGAKAILDLPRTLEMLETLGVPVIGLGTAEFPAFYCRGSGLKLDLRADSEAEAADLLAAHWALGLGGALLANPIPAEHALDDTLVRDTVARAVAEADAAGIAGAEVTPYLLGAMERLTAGRSVVANLALLRHNAGVAGRIAVKLAARAA